MVYPSVRRDNPRGIARGLSPVQMDNHVITIYTARIAQSDILQTELHVRPPPHTHTHTRLEWYSNGYRCMYMNGSLPHRPNKITSCNSYIMVCPPVHGDNPRALVNAISPVHVNNHGITIYTT